MSDPVISCENCTIEILREQLKANTQTIETSSDAVAKAKLSNKHLAPIVNTIESQLEDYRKLDGEKLHSTYNELQKAIKSALDRVKNLLNTSRDPNLAAKIEEGFKNLKNDDIALENEYATSEIDFMSGTSLEVKEANRKVLIADQHFTNHFYASLERRIKEVSESFNKTKELQESNLTEQAVKYAGLYICDQQLSLSAANADHQTATKIITFPSNENDYTNLLVKYGCDLFQHRIALDKIRLQAEKAESDFETLKLKIDQNKKSLELRIRELAETIANL
jgi:hypothetical protein